LYADTDLAEDIFQRAHDFGALGGVIDPFDVKMDEAFAAGIGSACRFEFDKPAGSVAPHQKNRMNEQTNLEAAAG
jgi:hypothetical protein